MKERLYDIIDADKNDKLTVAEIVGALGKPWHAQSISQLVVKYESEWLYKADKWSSLDQYMGSPNPSWDAEKARIEKLAWWGDLSGKQGISVDGKVWHLHPVGVIAYLGARGGCSCTDDITKEQLKSIAPTATSENIDKYINSISEMFRRFGITKCISKVHVLAQMLHESGALQFVTEGLDPTKPLPAYHPYIGRGLIQVTGEGNYRDYGTSIGENLLGSPDMLKMAAPPHCVVSVGWYWVDYKSLLVHSDRDDFIFCTARVNGGFNGYDDRLRYVNNALQVLGLKTCAELNHSGIYRLEDSKAFESAKFSFAWGLWSDPDSGKHGKSVDSIESIKGYKRFLKLYLENPAVSADTHTTYYATGRIATVAKQYAEQRVLALGGTL